jgi:hypothetical protein
VTPVPTEDNRGKRTKQKTKKKKKKTEDEIKTTLFFLLVAVLGKANARRECKSGAYFMGSPTSGTFCVRL